MKSLITNISDFLQYFYGKISDSILLESVSSLTFKETEVKFLFQIKPLELPSHFLFRITYISFGSEDFQEKKALFFDLMRTFIFLFT